MKSNWLILGLFVSVFFISSCGKSNKAGSVTVSLKSAASTFNSKLSDISFFNSVTFFSRTTPFGDGELGTGLVSSIKYYVNRIQLCNSVTVNGTGYSDTSGCVTVYENETDDYDAFGCSEASSAGSDKYIDILSSSERATLTRTVSLAEGTYNYGLINWYKPIKVTGSITRNNNTTLYTKSGTCVPNAGNPYTLASSDMTTSSAEESIVALNNGGSFFKFQTPFNDDPFELRIDNPA